MRNFMFFFFVLPLVGAMDAYSASARVEKATLAGGCFWCLEKPLEVYEGVIAVISGYSGGKQKTADYKKVSSGKTKHYEVVQVSYDPAIITYSDILQIFWRQIDPTDEAGQFVDKGPQYKTAIFYHNSQQKKLAEQSIKQLIKAKRFPKKIVTPVMAFESFYPAEDYHQDFYKKSPGRYNQYRRFSGRDEYINKIWKDEKVYVSATARIKGSKYMKLSEAELKKKLTPMQYQVTQEEGTEPPFKNQYWDNKEPGIYVDIVSGEALFSSTDKFKSGSGWPSFTRPLEKDNIVEKSDRKLFMKRTEVRSKHGDSHLGHVFDDGPAPTGLRYCINSAALDFIPVDKLKEKGFEKYLSLFEKKK